MRVRLSRSLRGKKWHVIHGLALCMHGADIPLSIRDGHSKRSVIVNFNDDAPDDWESFTTLDDRGYVDHEDICSACLKPFIRGVKVGWHHKYREV